MIPQTIPFNGHKGKVIESSPHGNFLIVRLTPFVTICGTYSNQWEWEDNNESQSGFSSFITYLGFDSISELSLAEDNLCNWLEARSAKVQYFRGEIYRSSKRSATCYEIKISGLSPDDVVNLIEINGGWNVLG